MPALNSPPRAAFTPKMAGDIPLQPYSSLPSPRPPSGGAQPSPAGGAPIARGSPVSPGTSSDAAEYSENARLVASSALSDDGMTPFLQVRS